jgi:hypothetical protein
LLYFKEEKEKEVGPAESHIFASIEGATVRDFDHGSRGGSLSSVVECGGATRLNLEAMIHQGPAMEAQQRQ